MVSVKNSKTKVIVAGDFNLDYLKVGDSSYQNSGLLNKLSLWSASYGLSQLITSPTRFREVNAKNGVRNELSLLDHLYSADEERFELIECGVSDHQAILLTLNTSIKLPRTVKFSRRDWRKYNDFNLSLMFEKDVEFKKLVNESEALMDVESLNEGIKRVHHYILEKLAPFRVFRMRSDSQLTNSSIEALKKKRNRAYRSYSKTGDESYLKKSKDLSKKLKKQLKYTEKKRILEKSKAKDPRTFWSLVKELRGNKPRTTRTVIRVNENTTTADSRVIASTFGNFFTDKVQKLSKDTWPECEEDLGELLSDNHYLEFSIFEVCAVGKSLKSKKSFGIDGVPMCIIKDTVNVLKHLYHRLFNLASKGMPEVWKMARVIPLFKKGDKLDTSNYRPISNLCSIGKYFEKLVLLKMNEYGDLEGEHQHGFKPRHSTTTAILDIQRILAKNADEGYNSMIYSVDLSAAFDMLRRKTLIKDLVKNEVFSPGLVRIINDFLSSRKCVVEVDGTRSEPFDVKLGCVQGSVLGPKLFNIYTRLIPLKLPLEAYITTYADDSYVILRMLKGNIPGMVKETEECLRVHVEYLKSLGMVVNQGKTEIMFVPCSRRELFPDDLKCNGSSPLKEMKVLGVTMDMHLNWSIHIAKTVNKQSRMTGALKFLRRRLPAQKFLQVLTSQYYGTSYYACQSWLGSHTKKIDLKKLEAMHYRMIRISVCDWQNQWSRSSLDQIGRAKPSVWAKYATANLAIKILRDHVPTRLYRHLNETLYYERRSANIIKFYDSSSKRVGKNAIGNRLKNVFDEINNPITLLESNDSIRLLLKKTFFKEYDQPPLIPVGVCFNGPGKQPPQN